MAQWSHSGLKGYETCPRQFHEVKILKRYPREETEATMYGTQLHEQAELFIRDGKPLAPGFDFLQPTLEMLNAMPGRKLTEHQMALTQGLQPCAFKDPDYWCRGIADLVIINDENLTARVFDYKSGSDKYPDTDQLTLMSLMVLAHFPHIREVSSGLLFVVKDSVVRHRVHREQWAELWWGFRERVARLDASLYHDTWNPKSSGLCKKHCPVVTCEFCGRR